MNDGQADISKYSIVGSFFIILQKTELGIRHTITGLVSVDKLSSKQSIAISAYNGM